MNVGWLHYQAVAEGAPGGSLPIARGYFKLAFYLYRALREIPGIRVVDMTPGNTHPKMVLHVTPPHLFEPIPGKVNVLVSMWEGDALPPAIAQNIARADWCVVPSKYCQAVWRRHGLEAAVMPLGLPEPYIACDPARPILANPDRVLRFLWVGSRLARKGWEFLAPAWARVFRPSDPAELYVKTIGDGTVLEAPGCRATIDQRDLDEGQMFELYRSADVFLFPSYGEGFGLPALEAMATGCLVVAPEISGLTEFVNQYTALPIELGAPVVAEYGAEYVARFPTVEGLARALATVKRGWGTAPLETIRRTGCQHARKFTWRASAERLVEILRAIAEKKGPSAGGGPRCCELRSGPSCGSSAPTTAPTMTGARCAPGAPTPVPATGRTASAGGSRRSGFSGPTVTTSGASSELSSSLAAGRER
jgi:glycosyltransferase involved in cell wall biosynthesis